MATDLFDNNSVDDLVKKIITYYETKDTKLLYNDNGKCKQIDMTYFDDETGELIDEDDYKKISKMIAVYRENDKFHMEYNYIYHYVDTDMGSGFYYDLGFKCKQFLKNSTFDNVQELYNHIMNTNLHLLCSTHLFSRNPFRNNHGKSDPVNTTFFPIISEKFVEKIKLLKYKQM